MASVTLKNLTKVYPEKSGTNIPVVRGINLEIKDREFMVFVGPSGCGKSTTLRMIAGLEQISGGTISIEGKVVNDHPPKDRDIAMVFQNYALYPHMSVYDNLAFGLKVRNFPAAEIDSRVREAATLLGLDAYLDRKPKALSGGQRQRVAVGRAIVRKPKVFLFDEPLSNLDAKMRVSTRIEISKLHARLGATTIYVTHDQAEAMTMGDRICVMKDGNIMQVATPLELYNHPANLYVAGFIGSPPMNLLKGKIQRIDALLAFVESNPNARPLTLLLSPALAQKAAAYVDQPIVFGIRPENIHDAGNFTTKNPDSTVEAKIEFAESLGAETYLYLQTGASSFIARVHPTRSFAVNDSIKVIFQLEHAHLFDPQTEKVIG